MSTSRTVICLLRNDLRLHDNELFHWAQRNAEYIVPLYCFDPRHYVGTYNYNLPKTGPFRLHFLLEGVKDLRNTMLSKGSNLVVRRGKPEEVVADLIKRLGSVSTVAFHEEVTSEELSVEKRVKDVCARMKVKVHTCWGSTLYHRDDVPFHHISRLPDVYTQFRKAVETQSRVRPLFPTPEQLKPLPDGLEEGAIPTAEDGDYVRRWVPELQGIRGADVHAPWTLSTASLSHAGVSLGETYPNPVVVAPEWSRHVNKKPSGARPSPRGKKGPSHTPKQHGDRGIDFYFSRSKNL